MTVVRKHRNVVLVAVFCLIAIEATNTVNGHRARRSPFKKHRIVIEGEKSSEWGSRPLPPPPPPSEPPQHTIVDHHHHTTVDHHHHHHHYYTYPPAPPQPPPPPPPTSDYYKHGSVRIEFSKGKGKKDKEELDRKKEEIKEAFLDAKEEFDRDKKEKLDKFKGDLEENLELWSKIPEKFASDLELIGSKIGEELEKEKHKDKGISIDIWKHKGKGKGGYRRRGDSMESGSREVHHHYYGSPEEVYQPPPPPPKKYYNEDETYDTINKYADLATGFVSFLEGGSQYRVPVREDYESDESSGYGGKGKGFQFSLWKGKGGRR